MLFLLDVALAADPTSLAPTPGWSWAASDGVTVGDVAVGDFDGDGLDDLALSGLGAVGPADLGVAVFHGGANGLAARPGLKWVVPPEVIVEDGPPTELVQLAVADVDGDGYDDLVVGVPGALEPDPADGRVEVYPGSRDGLASVPSSAVAGEEDAEERLGLEVVAAGDLDLDGFEDVLVGRDDTDAPTWVWLRGSRGGLSGSDWSTSGRSVVVADLTGDGHADVAVTDVTDPSVALFEGSPSGPRADPSWTLEVAAEALGAADATGDGVDDLGVYLAPASPTEPETELQWFTFAAGDPGTTPAATQAAPSHGTVDGLGDLDQDGYGDWAISEPLRTVVRLGSAPTVEAAAFVASSSVYTSGSSAGRVARAELDGDGCPDLVLHLDARWVVSDGSTHDDSVVGAWYCPPVDASAPTTTGTDPSGTATATTAPTASSGTGAGAGGPSSFVGSGPIRGGCGCASGAPGWPGIWALVALGWLRAASRCAGLVRASVRTQGCVVREPGRAASRRAGLVRASVRAPLPEGEGLG